MRLCYARSCRLGSALSRRAMKCQEGVAEERWTSPFSDRAVLQFTTRDSALTLRSLGLVTQTLLFHTRDFLCDSLRRIWQV